MRFGVNTFIWAGSFDPKAIPLEAIKRHGADGIEVPMFTPGEFDVEGVKRAQRDFDLGCTICAVNPAGINPTSDDPAVRARSLEHWKQVADTASRAGIRVVAGPLYAPVGYLPGWRRTPDEWRWGVEFYRALDPALRSTGVTFAIEPLNRFETYYLNTAADAVRFVEEIDSPQVGILFDTFHANIEEKDVAAAYRHCGRRLAHVHTCENDRGVPGTGHVDWPGVFAALKAIGYDGWLMIESFNSTIKELAAATAIWRDLAPSLDDIAFQGVAFLKKMAA
ncbi:MAG: sugar phosphate isomerase/epimerase [Acidobacteria bacterium]|nr:sugar phosphate isomerase/epimerase [Acidobacteriota bacterium]